MKIRQGFVSNSSSSSFICDICGRIEAGSDCECNEDYGLVQCENDHTFCEDELYSLAEGEETTIETEWNGSCLVEACCPICCFDVADRHELKKYLLKTTSVTEDDVLKYIQKKHPKRTRLYKGEYVGFYFIMRGICVTDLLTQLKEEFKTYKNFLEYIENEN